jgi:hypothetical protein
MTVNRNPAPEDLAAYEAALASAYAALDEAKTDVDFALEDVEGARDEARRVFGTPEATSAFSNAIADIHLAGRALADAIDALPALDENDVGREEDSASETDA